VGQPVVAGSPFNVAALIKLGYEVCVERGAGVFASFSDELYEKMGAQIVGTDEAWAADIVLCFDSPNDNHVALMKDGATLSARLNPWADKELPERYAKRGITALALDAVPRISRAQSLDVRSSMANVAGYRAVIEAANEFGRTFTGQVTAAGKTQPAKVYVIGVGVAGLAAIGISVRKYRPGVKAQTPKFRQEQYIRTLFHGLRCHAVEIVDIFFRLT
jgi:NAD(P) transhydrogenase subunit alpha